MTNKRPLQVLFATPECAPWARTGGLGEVCAGLPAALRALAVDARVLMPAYPSVLAQARGLRHAATFAPEAGLPEAALLRGRLPNGVPALVVDCPPLYARPSGPYQDAQGVDYDDNALRFGLLSRIAARLASGASPLSWRPHVLHCNDWPAGLAPAYLKLGLPQPAASLMAVHNLAFQGIFPMASGMALGLPAEAMGMHGVEYWGQLSFLKAGLYYADRIVTVSPTYAREILGDDFGCGLQGLLQARREDVSGLLNGIDTALWSPASDRHIARNYDDASLPAKAANKAALQRELGLETDDGVLLLGMASRLTDQKGADIVLEALPALLERRVQLALLGCGDAPLEAALRDAGQKWPGRVGVRIGFDEGLAHRIEAGADAFLMPSRFEPCGLNQMYSQRYGTPPIVRATGGLADSVHDHSPEALASGKATGFVVEAPTAAALVATVDRVAAVRADAAAWDTLRRNGMRRDFSWQASAEGYVALYQEMLRPAAAAPRKPRSTRGAGAAAAPARPRAGGTAAMDRV